MYINQLDKPETMDDLTYHAIVGTALTTEIQRLVIKQTLINNPIGEHGLRRNPEDEHPEREVFRRFRIRPHIWTPESAPHTPNSNRLKIDRDKLTLHTSLNPLHSTQNLPKPLINTRPFTPSLNSINDLESTTNEPTRVLDHVNMGQDETGLGALGVETALESACQTHIGIDQALSRVG